MITAKFKNPTLFVHSEYGGIVTVSLTKQSKAYKFNVGFFRNWLRWVNYPDIINQAEFKRKGELLFFTTDGHYCTYPTARISDLGASPVNLPVFIDKRNPIYPLLEKTKTPITQKVVPGTIDVSKETLKIVRYYYFNKGKLIGSSEIEGTVHSYGVLNSEGIPEYFPTNFIDL